MPQGREWENNNQMEIDLGGKVPYPGVGKPVASGASVQRPETGTVATYSVINDGAGSGGIMRTGIYQHYKGGYYQVLAVGEHTETKEKMVVYVSLDATLPGPRVRVRPLEGPEGWDTPVDYKIPETLMFSDGTNVPRFRYIGDEIPR